MVMRNLRPMTNVYVLNSLITHEIDHPVILTSVVAAKPDIVGQSPLVCYTRNIDDINYKYYVTKT